jgi:molybdopterin molybdotransferase
MAAERAKLTPYAEALEMVLERAAPLGTEERPLDNLLGRVLAAPVAAGHAMPFFDNSAVDGYALTGEDVEALERDPALRLKLGGTIAAGADATGITLEPGTAMKVLTGAPTPAGAATMVMQEDADADGANVGFTAPVRMGRNIRYRGEEFEAGSKLVPEGITVTPGIVAALAAAGYASAPVYRRPAVGILVTGDELLAPGSALRPGAIYESNSYGIAALLQVMAFAPATIRRVADNAAETRAALSDLLAECDVVLTSGGVSVGEFDTIRPALAALGVETVFWGVAIKPGKPFYFGTLPGRSPAPVVFGLPGNPVAAMVTFHALVRPYLLRATGLPGRPATARARLARALRKKPGRLEFVPCRLRDRVADPEIKRGSHMLGTLTEANGLVLFAREAEALDAGSEVDVMLLDGGAT